MLIHIQNVERLKFSDAAIALDIDGNGGQAYRVYQAAFNRSPDKSGLGYWIDYLDQGHSISEVANGFVDSAEFKKLYGENPIINTLVTQFYQNVLHRSPDQGGLDYWVNELNTGHQTIPQVLGNFSESTENKTNLATVIGNGFEYTPWGS